MTKKVFLVTDGEYSDYKVVAVFSKKERAEEFTRLGEFENVEEYPLDIEFKDPGYDTYEVEINEEGVVRRHSNPFIRILPRINDKGIPTKECWLRTWKDSDPTSIAYREGLEGKSKSWRLFWIGEAKSEEHARRHVEELRRQILAGQRPEEVDMGKN